MKKVIPGFICLFLLTTCGLEMPESITIKGKPGLYVPLGSPFAGMKEEDRLENLISPNGIMKMMNNSGADKGLEVYEVSEAMAQSCGIDKNILTYLVHYPLADMPLDLQEYMNKAADAINSKGEISIPPIPGAESLPAGTYYYIYEAGQQWSRDDLDLPFLKIPLNDMVKLVKKVTKEADGKFGLEIDYTPQLANNLWLKIPAFGINEYMKGVRDPANPNKLQFFSQTMSDEFFPQTQLENSEFLIYARISGPCSGDLVLGILFDWVTAVINTGAMNESNFFEEYPIENSLGNFLGGTVSFKKVEGYVYMSGLGSDSSVGMTVDIGNGPQKINLKEATKSFDIKEKPDGTKIIDGRLADSSCAPLNLAPIFKSAKPTIKAKIEIAEFPIARCTDDDKIIKISLYALIPLDLEVSGKEAPDVTIGGVNIKNTYVSLDLGDTLSKMGTGDDLFGRKAGEDSLINEIESIGIILKNIDITVMDKTRLAVLIETKDPPQLLEFKNNSVSLQLKDLSIPFNPKFTVLLLKDIPGGSSGSFKIFRTDAPKFDFKLYVEAKAALDFTLNL